MLTKEQQDLIIKLYVTNHYSIPQTAFAVGVGYKTVRKFLLKHELVRSRSEAMKYSMHKENCKCGVCVARSGGYKGSNNPMFGVQSPSYIDGRSKIKAFCSLCNAPIGWATALKGSGLCRSCSILGRAASDKCKQAVTDAMNKFWSDDSKSGHLRHRNYSKHDLVKHHIYLRQYAPKEVIVIPRGTHRKLHWKAYNYLVLINQLDYYLKYFKLEYPNWQGEGVLHHLDCNRANNNKDNLLFVASKEIHNKLHQEAYNFLVFIGEVDNYLKWFFLMEKKSTETDLS